MHFQTAHRGGPPLLLVHGFACDLTDWHAQLQGLTTTVIACDLPGHGSTPGRACDCTVENYGAQVAALLNQLELTHSTLVGHSMGCRVVLEAYRQAPQRVAKLVLLDGSRVAVGDRCAAQRGMTQQIQSRGYSHFVQEFFDEMFLPTSQPDLKASVLARAHRLPSELGAHLLADVAGWDADELPEALQALQVPLLAIQTTFVNSQSQRVPLSAGQSSPWLDLIRPYGRIEVLPGCGHFAHLEQPDQINALLTA